MDDSDVSRTCAVSKPMISNAKHKLMSERGWSESRAYNCLRIASSLTNLSMEAVSASVLIGEPLPVEAVRRSEEILVSRSKLESLRILVHGRAACIIDSILRS